MQTFIVNLCHLISFLYICSMKVIHNRFIPFRGYWAINLFGVVFVRKGYTLDDALLNHEAIHTAQMREMLYVFFYLWYVIEWVLRLSGKGNAYEKISFEREAYSNQNDMEYLSRRKHFAWWKYFGR